ncbi:MAG: NAD(P)H-binding protein [bacterium]|nr:NAD(P)H-binding protein [bacterium]
MKILLLGTTGRTGKLALQEALKKGFQVNCLARNSERIASDKNISVFEGDPTQKSDLEKAIEGCDAVISVLNISRTSDFPWARLRTPEFFLSDAAKLLVEVMTEKEINRITVCSAWGVNETKKDIPGWFRWFINNSNIGVAYKDHERQEKILTESNLDWTIVRPVGLGNSKKSTEIIQSFNNNPKPGLLVSRLNVARYLVDSLERTDLVRRKVVVS